MFRYQPIKESLTSVDCGSYISFGIQSMQSASDECVEIRSVSDVSVDGTFVEKLCRIFTENQLDPIHMTEVIEDSII